MPWTFLGEGAYNRVYKNDTGDLVFKVQLLAGGDSDLYDAPERSTELMRELYPELAHRVEIITDPIHGKGWTFPFIEGEHPTDDEMVEALIDIFNKTGRILLDGCLYENFIRTSATHPTYPNRTFCIDIGMLVNIQGKDASGVGGRMRRKSKTSDDLFAQEKDYCYDELWGHSEIKDLFSTHLIMALILIRKYRPLIQDVSFFKRDRKLIKTLSKLYEKEHLVDTDASEENKATKKPALTHEIEEALKQYIDPLIAGGSPKRPDTQAAATSQRNSLRFFYSWFSKPNPYASGKSNDSDRPMELNQIQENCSKILEAYIKTRGTIDTKTNCFKPTLTTYLFRNHSLTIHKVKVAREIISNIQRAASLDEIELILDSAQKDKLLIKSSFHSALKGSLIQCKNLLPQSLIASKTKLTS